MDIIIEAPGHKKPAKAKEFYTNKLQRRYTEFRFIQKIHLRLREIKEGTSAQITLYVDSGSPIFAKDINKLEEKAFASVLRKLTIQLEKYKEVHYHS